MKYHIKGLFRIAVLYITLLTCISIGAVIIYYFASIKQSIEAGMYTNLDIGQLLLSLFWTLIFLIIPMIYFFFNISILRSVFLSNHKKFIENNHRKKLINSSLLFFIMIFNIIFSMNVVYLAYAVLTE